MLYKTEKEGRRPGENGVVCCISENEMKVLMETIACIEKKSSLGFIESVY